MIDFDRPPSSSSLGTAESGQTWQATANVGIEATDQAFTMYGYAATLPIFYAEDTAIRTGVSIPYQGNDPKEVAKMGRGGRNIDPMVHIIDRPTLVVAWGFANIENESGVDWSARFFIDFEIDGVDQFGRLTAQHTLANDATGNKHRVLATSHAALISATSDNPSTLELWWGYQQSNSGLSSRQATIRNQKMTVFLSYSPDRAGVFTTTKRPLWIQSGKMRREYRNIEGED